MGDSRVARLRLLGGCELELAGLPVQLRANGRRLLAFLGVCGGSTRAAVAGSLWPELTDRNADGCLRTAMWRLHREHGDLFDCSAGRLNLSRAVNVDSRDFVTSARTAISHPDLVVDPTEFRYVGDLLPGWYDDWVIFERERLRQLRLHALEALARWLAAGGHYADALELALEAVRTEPLRESVHRVVIAIHLAENNVGEAARHYSFFRGLLYAELGVAPSLELTTMLPPSVLRGHFTMRDAQRGAPLTAPVPRHGVPGRPRKV